MKSTNFAVGSEVSGSRITPIDYSPGALQACRRMQVGTAARRNGQPWMTSPVSTAGRTCRCPSGDGTAASPMAAAPAAP